MQGSYPTFGLSVKKDIDKDYAVQGVLRANIVSFDKYDFSTVGIGGGLHYKF